VKAGERDRIEFIAALRLCMGLHLELMRNRERMPPKAVSEEENHRRVLRSSLRVIEDRLNETLSLLNKKDSGSNLCEFVDDVSGKAKTELLNLIGDMLREIGELFSECHLEKEEYHIRHSLLALMSDVWVILEEIAPRKISAEYGAMPEHLQSVLNAHRETLLKKSKGVITLLQRCSA
jgi:hypothetical protein